MKKKTRNGNHKRRARYITVFGHPVDLESFRLDAIPLFIGKPFEPRRGRYGIIHIGK